MQIVQAVRRVEEEAGLRLDPAVTGCNDEKLVPRVDDVAAVVPEDLGRDREVEREGPLVDDGRDGAHVRNLAIIG